MEISIPILIITAAVMFLLWRANRRFPGLFDDRSR